MTRRYGLVHHARRMARRNPLGLPEELVLGGTLLAIIAGGAYLWRKYANASPVGSGKSWTEITANPQINAGTVYRVTMAPVTTDAQGNPITPPPTEDQASTAFDQFSDSAQGGGVTVWDPPLDSTWADQDASRWHFMFLATTTATPVLDASARIWGFQ